MASAENNDPKNKTNQNATANTNAATADASTAPAADPNVRQGQVEGFAFTLNALASFMIKMMRSDYFEDVELKATNEIQVQQKKAYNFVLTFNIHYLSDEELRNNIATSTEQEDSQQASASHKSLN